MICPKCGAEDDYVIDNIWDVSLDGGYPFVDVECHVHCYECGHEYDCKIVTKIVEGSEVVIE